LGDKPVNLLRLHHNQCANVLVGHDLDRLVHGGRGRQRVQVLVRLLRQDLCNRSHRRLLLAGVPCRGYEHVTTQRTRWPTSAIAALRPLRETYLLPGVTMRDELPKLALAACRLNCSISWPVREQRVA